MLFDGLGFPIVLLNVPMVRIRGELTPDINYNKLQKAVLLLLCHKKSPLTGNEIKFIRKYFALTTKDFGHIIGYTHSAILKWETHENQIARMTPTTEFYLRLYVLNYIQNKQSNLKILYSEIQIPELAQQLKNSKNVNYDPLFIDLQKEFQSAA